MTSPFIDRITADDVRVASPGDWVDAEAIAEDANSVPLWAAQGVPDTAMEAPHD